MKNFYLLLLLAFLFNTSIYGQQIASYKLSETEAFREFQYSADSIETRIKKYDVFYLDLSDISEFQTGINNQIESIDIFLNAGPLNTTLYLYNTGMISQNYIRSTTTGAEVEGTVPSPMFGRTEEGQESRMTINTDFLSGFIAVGETLYYIESVSRYDANASEGLFIIYDKDEAVEENEVFCGADAAIELPEEVEGGEAAPTACYELEYALASDYKMFQKYGSSANVENHMVTVTNNVQTNYANDFVHEVQFVIVETYIVNCNGCDPWTASTDAGTFLNSFSNWARSSSGFSAHHDVASCWTNRNFNGGTVGIAWLNTLCGYNRYNCLQDFTTNHNFLRVMTAHEIGHNFGCQHDAQGSPYIMAPAVNNTNLWSSNSISTINNKILANLGGSCFEPCGVSSAPVADFTSNVTQGCAPLTVNFTDLSTNDPHTWTWTFPGGSPQTSHQKNPTVVYNTPGVYNVTLTAENDFGSGTETKVAYITVEDVPEAAFSFVTNELEVSFFNESTGPNITGYNWNFGDGGTSTQENPVYTYSTPGTYTVTLTVTNHCGSKSIQHSVIAVPVPIADFDASAKQICVGDEVMFFDLSQYAEEYEWTFEGGTPGTSDFSNPIVTYNSPGVFNVTLRVTNHSGSNQKINVGYITVSPTPTASFNYNVDGPFVMFENTSQNATSYHWDFGDGQESTEINPIHTYSSGGDYTVTLSAINDCGVDYYTVTVNIVAAPLADFSSNKIEACVGEQVLYYNLSFGADSYSWTFEGGTPSTSALQNPVVTYNQPGTFTVSLKVENPAGSDTKTEVGYITILPNPVASFNVELVGLFAIFENTSQNATSYHWDFGDGTESTEENPIHTYITEGSYTIRLTAISDCGENVYEYQVNVLGAPIADFSANITDGCVPMTVQFSNLSSGGDSYLWTFPGGTPATSTLENPTVTYNSVGTFDVSLKVTNNVGEDIIVREDYITVKDKPTASFTQTISGLTVTFNNTSQDADTYHWNFGDGNTSTVKNPVHTYTQGGSYTVILTASNACGDAVYQREIQVVGMPVADFSADKLEGCLPMTVKFQNNSTEGETYLWTFEGGTPATSTEASPTITYNSAGTFDVSLKVTNSSGEDTKVRKDYITVKDKPVADFTATTDGLTVAFANNSQGADSYHWNFGDGNTSTQENPTHTYAESGEYTVTLTVTNECGSTEKTRKLGVGDFPNAQFTASGTNGCVPFTVTFTNLYDGDVSSYLWTFEGGVPATSTQAEPSVTYNAVGSYDVMLIVENGLGRDTVIKENFISVGDVAISDFSYVTSGLTTSFTEEVEGTYTSLLWSFGDGNTSTEENPVHTYADYGDYFVSLIAYNACGSDTIERQLHFMRPATAGFTAGQVVGCAPLIVQMNNESSGDDLSYLWTFDGGSPASSTEENPEVIYTEAGTYSVQLIAYNAVSSDTIVRESLIEVLPLPIADFNFEVSNDTVSFNNLSKHGDSYHWDFGDGNESTEKNPVHVYEEGVDGHEITLTVFNQCDTVSKTILIDNTMPPVAKMDAESRKICVGTSLTFYDISEGVIGTRKWIFEGGEPETSGQQNPTVQYNQTGRYSVTLIVENVNGADTIHEKDFITVIDVPIADFDFEIIGDSVKFIQKSTFADEYRWNFGNGTLENGSEPGIRYEASGNYTVQLIASNICGADTISKQIEIITAVVNPGGIDFKVYPNPFNDQINVQFTDALSGKVALAVTDMSGRVVLQEEFYVESAMIKRISLSGIVPGMYILKLNNDGKVDFRKLIKQ